MPTISLLILTYNSQHYIDPLFSSIKSVLGEEIGKGLIEIVVVDNSSTDSTAQEVKKHLDRNTFFYQNRDNAGYAKGINIAAKKAKGDILLVVNPDSRLVSADTRKIIEEFKANEKLAVAGFAIENEEGKREKTAGKFYNFLRILFFCIGLEDMMGVRFSPTRKMKVDYVSGGLVAFRKEYFERLNGFDEDFFMYVEDMDICYRAKMKGYETYFLPFALTVHKGQGSSSRGFAIVNIYKGLHLFFKKHSSFLYQILVNNLLSIKAATIIFLGSILGRKELVSTYLKALKAIS